MQRVTAVVMVVYTLFFLSVLLGLPQVDYAHWKALWELPVMRYATVLFVVSVLLHAWVGVRNIFMDYVTWGSIYDWVYSCQRRAPARSSCSC